MTTKIITITALFISCQQLAGQEIRALSYRHAITQAVEEGELRSQKATVDYIYFEGDFLEDFSDYHTEVYPRSDVWEDKYAFINSTFADSMISLGVATLDAYDFYGYPYYSTEKKKTSADTLTSRPFKFAEDLPDNNLYFSFFYQPGGKGYMPDSVSAPNYPPGDVLLVEFFDATDTIWTAVDTILDLSSPHNFKQAIYQVPDTLIKEGFRFRFRNFVSIDGYEPGVDLGRFGNEDMWHIDYIQLRSTSNPNELTTIKDIAITQPLPPSIESYTAVPWRHYTMAIPSLYRTDYPFFVKNYFADGNDAFRFERQYISMDVVSGETLAEKSREYIIQANQELKLTDNFNTGFYENSDDVGRLKITAYIDPVPDDIIQPLNNDTVIRYETYYDYYAYDDGTAEYGYGIGGEPQDLSRTAVKFKAFRNSSNPDTLRAVLIYFAKSVDSVTKNSDYKITIRKPDNTGAPSNEIIASSDELTPDYTKGINQFTRVELKQPVLISDTFFVVIEQLNGYLNIGYDINNKNRDKIYSYINQRWEVSKSGENGSLMVRPCFSRRLYHPPNNVESEIRQEAFYVYPNPARTQIRFSLPHTGVNTWNVQVFDITGQLLFQDLTDENNIPIEQLNPGMYFLVVSETGGTARYTSKFIKE